MSVSHKHTLFVTKPTFTVPGKPNTGLCLLAIMCSLHVGWFCLHYCKNLLWECDTDLSYMNMNISAAENCNHGLKLMLKLKLWVNNAIPSPLQSGYHDLFCPYCWKKNVISINWSSSLSCGLINAANLLYSSSTLPFWSSLFLTQISGTGVNLSVQ